MIYTVTFNPSIDYVVYLEEYIEGAVNRTKREEVLPGGKGINVSTVLKSLGVDSTALAFTAGFTGKEIERLASELGIQTDFIEAQSGNSRINVKIKENHNKRESEINGQGPVISKENINELYEKLSKLKEGDSLVLAGSIPDTLPDDIYESILNHLKAKKIHVVVDATNNLLMNVLKYHPFLIKPNRHELSEIFGVTIKDREEIIFYANELIKKGARNVLVSMDKDGAVLVTENKEAYYAAAPSGAVVNSVGAGDSMVAGFLAGYLENKDYGHALRMGVASGSASAFSSKLATQEEIMALLQNMPED